MSSFGLKIYYRIRSAIPRRLQIFLRRLRASVKIRTHMDVWPIDTKSARLPVNWRGWPDGKQFAFILTHDVDTARGQDRCRDLARIEQGLGFVSSFNFVPERYKVSKDLRDQLTDSGFEVGVHGLNHDGKYYFSRKIFQDRIVRINHYLKEWGSVGFRSPSMLHNLDWLHDLNIQYDSSTFDTDPFEPQSDAVGTIFPFWVPSGNGKGGYIEIPYTLPQDFTLFVILRQTTSDIWKRKLEWIARNGGMALMLVHPDYIRFAGGKNEREEYHWRIYHDFLRHVKDTYEGQYYHVLPKELVRFFIDSYSPKGTQDGIE